MKLAEEILFIDPKVQKKAELLLKSETFDSLKNFGDGGYEAFIEVKGGILLPEVTMDEEGDVLEYECQCKGSHRRMICVHIAAVMLGMVKVLQAECDDYHEAVMKLKRENN